MTKDLQTRELMELKVSKACAQFAHSAYVMLSGFVIKRPPADAEDRRSQFLISPDVREGHANQFFFDRIQTRADSNGRICDWTHGASSRSAVATASSVRG